MRVDSQVYISNPSRFQLDDLLVQAWYRSNARPAARFQEALRLANTEASATDSAAANDRSRNQSEAEPAKFTSVARSEPPVTQWTPSVAPGACGEGTSARQAGRNHAAADRLVARLDSVSGEGLAAGSAAGNREGIGAAQAERNSAAPAASGTRLTAEAATPIPVPDPVATALIHTPMGTYDPNSRVHNLVTDVAADSPEEAYFITHAPAEWMHNPESVKRFTELYGAQAAAVLEYFGTVPNNIDPVWLVTPEQMARIDAEGNLLLSLQDYYHMTDEMAAMTNFNDLFPGVDTDLPFIPSSQPFMTPSELAQAAPALLAKLNAAAGTTPNSTNASHRGA
jgi:hypothetical protein